MQNLDQRPVAPETSGPLPSPKRMATEIQAGPSCRVDRHLGYPRCFEHEITPLGRFHLHFSHIINKTIYSTINTQGGFNSLVLNHTIREMPRRSLHYITRVHS